MKKIVFLLVFGILLSCSSKAQKKTTSPKKYSIEKTEAEWKSILSPLAYSVLRKSGTERPFTSPLNKNYENGIYVCAACNTALYQSEHKFDSGTGWPSFDRGISENIEVDVDYKIGYARTELKCNTCGGHLGHSFDDGPAQTTGKRHCINGAALKFVAKKK